MTVVLTTERLVIDPLGPADAAAFASYRCLPEVARFQTWGTGYSLADAESLIAAQPAQGIPNPGEWVQLGLRLRDSVDEALVGDVAVGADAEEPDTYELGVTLDPRHQGRGYAGEALEAVIHWLMVDRGAHRVVMQGDARNAAVIALMRRLGLRHEGTILDGDWFKGEWTTLERYAVLRQEWTSA